MVVVLVSRVFPCAPCPFLRWHVSLHSAVYAAFCNVTLPGYPHRSRFPELSMSLRIRQCNQLYIHTYITRVIALSLVFIVTVIAWCVGSHTQTPRVDS